MAAVLPNVNEVVPAPAAKPEPMTVTELPARRPPDAGLTLLTATPEKLNTLCFAGLLGPPGLMTLMPYLPTV